MRAILLLLFISLPILATLNSCGVSQPIKGTYQQGSFKVESEKSPQDVWSNIIDFFAESGVGIDVIEKESGFISSSNMAFSFTEEDDAGNLVDSKAWAVIMKERDGFGSPYKVRVSGEWNVRIKPSGAGSIVSINVVNLVAQYYVPPSEYVTGGWRDLEVVSTGYFERSLSNIFK